MTKTTFWTKAHSLVLFFHVMMISATASNEVVEKKMINISFPDKKITQNPVNLRIDIIPDNLAFTLRIGTLTI